jgi:hypothetical protein
LRYQSKPQLKIYLLHTLEKVFCKDQKQDMCELLPRNPLASDPQRSSFYLLATLMALPCSASRTVGTECANLADLVSIKAVG